MVTWRAETPSAYRPASTPLIWLRARAAPSAGSRSRVAAYRAPSEAAAVRVLRTNSTRATWRMPRKTGTSRTSTSTKSTTAAPPCRPYLRLGGPDIGSAVDAVQRGGQHGVQLGAGHLPESGHEPGG